MELDVGDDKEAKGGGNETDSYFLSKRSSALDDKILQI